MLAVTFTSKNTMVYNAVPALLKQSWRSADVGWHINSLTVQPGLYHASAMFGLGTMPLSFSAQLPAMHEQLSAGEQQQHFLDEERLFKLNMF